MGWHGPITARQADACEEWLREQWNRPSRSDYYAMQTAMLVGKGNAKHPGSITMDRMKIAFSEKKKEEQSPMTPERLQKMKLASLSKFGPNVRIRLPDGRVVSKKEILEMTSKGDSVAGDVAREIGL